MRRAERAVNRIHSAHTRVLTAGEKALRKIKATEKRDASQGIQGRSGTSRLRLPGERLERAGPAKTPRGGLFGEGHSFLSLSDLESGGYYWVSE
jgi:hypothetical protein